MFFLIPVLVLKRINYNIFSMLKDKDNKNFITLIFSHPIFILVAIVYIAIFLVSYFVLDNIDNSVERVIESKGSSGLTESVDLAYKKTPEEYQQWLNTLRSNSQFDTQVDGGLREDENGNLIIERGVRDLFDYFMTGSAKEISLEEIIHKIYLYIDEVLSPSAAMQAKELLDNYVAYEMAQEEYHNSQTVNPYSLEGMEVVNYYGALLDQREQLRSDYLGSDARGQFYGDEEAYDRFTLERMRLARAQISEKQRNIAYEQLVEQLPEAMKSWYKEQEKIYSYLDKSLDQISNIIKSLGKEKIRQDRIVKYGYEVADRLDELDKKNHEWDSRIRNYISKKEEILSSDVFTDVEKHERIQALINKNFNERERLRVKPSASLSIR